MANKIKPFLLSKQKTEKIAPSYELPAKSKRRLKAPTQILSLPSSSENYTSLVLTISKMHALYTYATFLTGLNETNRSIKANSPSAMNTLKGIRKQKTEKIAPPFYFAAKLNKTLT